MVDVVFKYWGHYRVIHDGVGFRVKELTISPGKSISLQRHKHRLEHWYVVEGNGVVELGVSRFRIAITSTVDILSDIWHRVTNTGTGNLVIIEVWMGSKLSEDDIKRREEGGE